VSLHRLLHLASELHIRLELTGVVFDLTRVLLQGVLELLDHLQLSHFWIKAVKDAAKDIRGVLDLGITQLGSMLVIRIVDTVISFGISLTHLVFVVFVGLFALLFLYEFVVDVLEVL